MIDRVNDSVELAHSLADLLQDVDGFVNLIPYNPIPGRDWRPSPAERIEAFVGATRALTLPRVYAVNHDRARCIDDAVCPVALSIVDNGGLLDANVPGAPGGPVSFVNTDADESPFDFGVVGHVGLQIIDNDDGGHAAGRARDGHASSGARRRDRAGTPARRPRVLAVADCGRRSSRPRRRRPLA